MKITDSIYMIMANALALLLLAIGLLSPLTPSEGTPSFLELAIFAGCPFFILETLIFKARDRVTKFLLIAEIAIIASILFRVLVIVYKYKMN